MLKYEAWCDLVGLDVKPHQKEGYKWCSAREEDKSMRGGILCDEMGLGKTILMLGCMILNPVGQTLIVVPPSLLNQWKNCVKKFMKHNIFVYHGPNVRNTTLEMLKSKKFVLTTYGMIARRMNPEYTNKLWQITWNRLICDEAHHIRNPKTNVCQGAFKLRAQIKWFLTGTPIQNSTTDIKILFAMFGKIIRGSVQLRSYINSYVLRRTKSGVGIQIPENTRELVTVKWKTDLEKNLAATIHSTLNVFCVEVNSENVNSIIEVLDYESQLPLFVRARQVCIYPKLLEIYIQKLKKDGLLPETFTKLPSVTTSKLDAIVRKINSQPRDEKKIVFCYYRGEIDELKKRLISENYSVGVMDGRSKKKERLEVCDEQKAPDILLAQIQSTSEGLNLQHYCQVYFTSPHWNPAVEEQAMARAHRIGQTRPVRTFHFQMEGFGDGQLTLENYCLQVQSKKRELMALID